MISQEDLMMQLRSIDEKLERKLAVIAVGGTAMTLLGLKESTKDIDFCVETSAEKRLFAKAVQQAKSSLRIDLFKEGYIFSVQLPDDYVKKSRKAGIRFRNMELRTLSPIDIIVSKTDRLNERDIEDIRALIKAKRVNRTKLEQRYNQVVHSIPGREENFRHNMKVVPGFFTT